MRLFISVILGIALLSGCRSANGGFSSEFPQKFPRPDLPAILSSEEEAVDYLAGHFWSPFFDSLSRWDGHYPDSLIGGLAASDFRQAAGQYLLTLWQLPNERALQVQRSFLQKWEARLTTEQGQKEYKAVLQLLETYLYNPISEFRNEEFYIPVLESRISTGIRDSVPLSTYRYQLEKCRLNRVGTVAEDFCYATKDGRRHRLHEIREDFILLLFTNPGCPACRHTMEAIQGSELLMHHVRDGRLRLLNIYIDEDLESWYRNLKEYPEEWTNGYDPDFLLKSGTVYDVRAIPSLYLLNAKKEVVCKDVSLSILLSLTDRLLSR